MSSQEINFDLTQYATLREFAYDDNSLVKCVIGPAGSAKTSYIMIEALRRACMQAPAQDGVRYFKVLVIRNTYALLTKSTLDTAKRMIGGVTKFKDSPPPSGHARFDLADGTQVDFRMEFMSIDGEDAQSQLLGYEPTMVFIDEISELPESLVHAVIRRLGRYPSGSLGTPTWTGVVAATNGPMKSHWLYRWFLGKFDATTQAVIDTVEAESGRRFFRLFKQPAALLRGEDEDGREKWVPNPLAENVRNLPGGYSYYYQMLLDSNEQKIKAYVEGDFADIVTGKLVFPEFNRERHIVSHLDIDINSISQVYLAFHFFHFLTRMEGVFMIAAGNMTKFSRNSSPNAAVHSASTRRSRTLRLIASAAATARRLCSSSNARRIEDSPSTRASCEPPDSCSNCGSASTTFLRSSAVASASSSGTGVGRMT